MKKDKYVWFHLYEVLGVVKLIETEYRMVIAITELKGGCQR